MSQNAKHTPGPWGFFEGTGRVYYADNEVEPTIAYIELDNATSDQARADGLLIAAAPRLLAYAECEAAIACGKADPRYDATPVLISHGWNRETESQGLFLTRIRRNAIEAATGGYLGRAA